MAAVDPFVAPVSSGADAAASAAVVSSSGATLADGERPDNASPALRGGIRARVRSWIRTLHRDPTAEERAMQKRRQQLLDELTHAVADAPDDMPIGEVVKRLNHHRDD